MTRIPQATVKVNATEKVNAIVKVTARGKVEPERSGPPNTEWVNTEDKNQKFWSYSDVDLFEEDELENPRTLENVGCDQCLFRQTASAHCVQGKKSLEAGNAERIPQVR